METYIPLTAESGYRCHPTPVFLFIYFISFLGTSRSWQIESRSPFAFWVIHSKKLLEMFYHLEILLCCRLLTEIFQWVTRRVRLSILLWSHSDEAVNFPLTMKLSKLKLWKGSTDGRCCRGRRLCFCCFLAALSYEDISCSCLHPSLPWFLTTHCVSKLTHVELWWKRSNCEIIYFLVNISKA